ncbi:hypothetical protein HER10_EVM0007894 [Colletotrichum scovillei]|uniref:AAA family ATPase n=1 Tax=Colletotrichum scovillei TaxID=1209932 RepID=A0A9P7QXQ6_9PEZI|nr:uncharacterized protein HER10_EVM0007894 [Colletotrichum scovillei]KAF4784396.1 hypothetical protein HER10_EVM0007894 [Colletotrichum scovillei]KAG7044564.1 AAA family ATPase [Colletotrichum scovillei]KAG7049277.1 AAA family ATPase [Colletotrichum scovillei]KAG7064018.1 AAA family ATPase [Colletotrichum scovillei]
MQFNINTVALLAAALLPLASAVPSDANAVEATLAKRQRQYQCETSNNLGACNNAIAKLRGHEARGCDVWSCIGAFAALIPACGAAVDEFFLNPLADVACIGAVANFQGPCKGCEPF